MATEKEVKEALVKWVSVLENPEAAEDFKDYNKTLQFIFPDIDAKVQLVFEGPKTRIVEGFREDADMSLTVDAAVFVAMNSGEIDPMDAFMDGRLKPAGDISALEKLEILLDFSGE